MTSNVAGVSFSDRNLQHPSFLVWLHPSWWFYIGDKFDLHYPLTLMCFCFSSLYCSELELNILYFRRVFRGGDPLVSYWPLQLHANPTQWLCMQYLENSFLSVFLSFFFFSSLMSLCWSSLLSWSLNTLVCGTLTPWNAKQMDEVWDSEIFVLEQRCTSVSVEEFPAAG